MLTSVIELNKIYEDYNKKFFNGKLQNKIRIEWSKRLTSSAGICYVIKNNPQKNVIRLSTWYHERHPEEISETLLHEMIHLIIPNHGAEFINEINRIKELGGKVNRYAKERACSQIRWIYRCPQCNIEFKRQRRLPVKRNYICKRCKCSLIETQIKQRDSSTSFR